MRGISAEYLLDPGVLGGHWFADETTSSLRPPTSRFSLVILTSNCLSCLCISFSLATHFLGVPRLLRCAFIFWIATWSQIAIKTCTRYGCLDLLKLRATHADAQSRRGCGTEKPQTTTPCRPPLPAFTEDTQTSTQSSTNMSISALKVLPGSAFGTYKRSLMSDQKSGAL